MLGGCWELWVTGWIGREVGILWWTWLPSLAEHTDVLHLSQSSNRVVHALLAPASQLGWQPERQWINHVTWVVIDWSRIAQSYSDRCINTRGVPLITYRWHLLIYFIYITACAYNIHMIEWEYNYVAIYRQLYKSTKALILIIIITCEWELIKKIHGKCSRFNLHTWQNRFSLVPTPAQPFCAPTAPIAPLGKHTG